MLRLIILFCLTLQLRSQMHDDQLMVEPNTVGHRHFEHDPRVPLRVIKCLECYETPSTRGSACSRSRYCEGRWCVKGPDRNGIYRGCMHVLPFSMQIARCLNLTGDDGRVYENCYCNSGDFCNAGSAGSSLVFSCLLLVLLTASHHLFNMLISCS